MAWGCQIGFSCLAFAPALSYQKKKVDKSFSYAQRICCQVSNNVRTVDKYFETVDKSNGKVEKSFENVEKFLRMWTNLFERWTNIFVYMQKSNLDQPAIQLKECQQIKVV